MREKSPVGWLNYRVEQSADEFGRSREGSSPVGWIADGAGSSTQSADGPPSDKSAPAKPSKDGSGAKSGAGPKDGSGPKDSSAAKDGSGPSESQRRIRQALADAEIGPDTDPEVSRETNEDDLPIAVEARRAVGVLHPTGLPRPYQRRVVCVANQKGGVGKTTSAVNLGVALAMNGLRVLVIDLDPQGNASTGLNVDHHAGTPSIYDVLIEGTALTDVVSKVEGIPTLSCAPATIDLAGAEVELVSVSARETRLRQAIESYPEELDYVLIDCPPSLGLLTVNAMVAAEEVLIPIQCEYYALEGLGQLLRNIDLVKSHLNPRIRVSTILLTMYDGRTKLADQVAAEVRGHFKDTVLDTVIPRSVRVSEAPGYGQSVMTYDPGSRGATSYLAAAREIAERNAERTGS